MPNLHDAGGVLEGQRAEENGVHDGKNRGVGANTQGEQEDGHDREAWVAKEDAKAELKVGEEVAHQKALLAADERQVGGDIHSRRTKRQKVPGIWRGWACRIPQGAIALFLRVLPARYIVGRGRSHLAPRTTRHRFF